MGLILCAHHMGESFTEYTRGVPELEVHIEQERTFANRSCFLSSLFRKKFAAEHSNQNKDYSPLRSYCRSASQLWWCLWCHRNDWCLDVLEMTRMFQIWMTSVDESGKNSVYSREAIPIMQHWYNSTVGCINEARLQAFHHQKEVFSMMAKMSE